MRLVKFHKKVVVISSFLFCISIAEANTSMTDIINKSIKQEYAIQNNNDPELTALINTSIKNAENYRSMVPIQKNSTNKSANNEIHAFLFISFSMPDTLIKQYLIESKRYHIPLVIRGLVHNSMKETQEKLFYLLHGDNEKHIQGGIQINPWLFKQYAVHAVPALVIGHDAVTCQELQSCASPAFDIIYGNLSLKASLEKMADEGNVGESFATKALEYDNA